MTLVWYETVICSLASILWLVWGRKRPRKLVLLGTSLDQQVSKGSYVSVESDGHTLGIVHCAYKPAQKSSGSVLRHPEPC